MLMALVLSSLMSLQDAEPGRSEPRSSSRGMTFQLSPEGKVELTIREKGGSGEPISKTYRADSIEEFKKKYPDVAREFRLDRFLASPDGPSWKGWEEGLDLDRFWDERFGTMFSPWMNWWPFERPARSRPFGIQIGSVGEAMAAQLDLREGDGLLVREVTEGSPAANAGIRKHDVVLKINGAPVGDSLGFRKELRELREKGFELEIVRQGKRQTIRVAGEKS
jgi:hypothetical protein